MDAKFYVADEFRQEASGKATAIGLYPHNRLVAEIDREARKKMEEQYNGKIANAFERLSFLFSLDLPGGPHELSFFCLFPNGQVVGESGSQIVNVKAGDTLSHIVSAVPFLYDGEGEYTARLVVDSVPIDFKFSIIIKYKQP